MGIKDVLVGLVGAAAVGCSANNDPLHPSTGEIAQIGVRSAGGSFAVHVIGDGPEVGREVWARAQALSASGGSVTVEQVGAAESLPPLSF